jgi:hypothetical protein
MRLLRPQWRVIKAIFSNCISVPSTDKLLDHALGVKGKPWLSMHLKILLGYKIKFEGLYHEGFC